LKFKLITCEVFFRETCLAAATSPHLIYPEYTPKDAHNDSEFLRDLLQVKIEKAEKDELDFDSILLGYGLCGNSINGLKSNSIPLVVPRVHDCCTIFLGSKEKFKDHFSNRLSASWTTPGYLERGKELLREEGPDDIIGLDRSYQELVEQYGEENARYVWETLHPKTEDDNLIYIKIPELEGLGYINQIRAKAEAEGRDLEIIEGDIRLIESLLNGDWDEEEFLLVQPGQMIKAVYDQDFIITAE